ncbi:MAG: hypothetical protein K8H88_23505 [Sandaracinaceae bacterium]|nr:hypothetical protein [Sandaracinaceae bacterium]
MKPLRVSHLAFHFLLCACSGASGGDAGLDAAIDAPSASPDGGSDAGPPDRDSDGVPDALDCGPDDPATGRTASRGCMNDCGMGTEPCSDGTWGACSAPTDCLCDTAGMRRIVTCGRCGEQAQECQGGVWTATSACLNQGECEAGAVETTDPVQCGVDQRLCRSDCTWGDWTVLVPRGECAPGSSSCISLPGGGGDLLCTDDCRWVDNPCCPVPCP